MKPNISSLPGIYLHIPFCIHKCGYCDFYSVTDQSLRENFADSIITEMAMAADRYKEEVFDTLYIGGGTPSVLSSSELERIFNGIHKHFSFDPNTEITIEVNPGTIINQKMGEQCHFQQALPTSITWPQNFLCRQQRIF